MKKLLFPLISLLFLLTACGGQRMDGAGALPLDAQAVASAELSDWRKSYSDDTPAQRQPVTEAEATAEIAAWASGYLARLPAALPDAAPPDLVQSGASELTLYDAQGAVLYTLLSADDILAVTDAAGTVRCYEAGCRDQLLELLEAQPAPDFATLDITALELEYDPADGANGFDPPLETARFTAPALLEWVRAVLAGASFTPISQPDIGYGGSSSPVRLLLTDGSALTVRLYHQGEISLTLQQDGETQLWRFYRLSGNAEFDLTRLVEACQTALGDEAALLAALELTT